MQNIRYLQVTLWASLKTKNNGWLKSQETHFQVAITSAYAHIFRIILQHVFLALLVSFSLLFLLCWTLGQFASPPVFVEQMVPKCCVESCNDFWGVSHGPVLVVVQWSYVVPVLLGYNSIALMHQGKALINICPSPKSMEERMYFAACAPEQPPPCCRL